MYKTIALQIASAGGTLYADEGKGDILLFCNLPVGRVQNISELHGRQYYDRDLLSFVARMKKAVEAGKGVAVADIAYCKGADVCLTERITQEIGLLNLWGVRRVEYLVQHSRYGHLPGNRALFLRRYAYA